MSTSFFPNGTRLKRKNPTTAVYEIIPQVIIASFGSVETESDDYTNHDSTGGYREKALGLKDPGSIPCQVVFNPAELMHQQLFTDNKNATKLTWRIYLPNAAGVVELGAMTEFDAYVTGLNLPTEIGKVLRLDFSLLRTGAPILNW